MSSVKVTPSATELISSILIKTFEEAEIKEKKCQKLMGNSFYDQLVIKELNLKPTQQNRSIKCELCDIRSLWTKYMTWLLINIAYIILLYYLVSLKPSCVIKNRSASVKLLHPVTLMLLLLKVLAKEMELQPSLTLAC